MPTPLPSSVSRFKAVISAHRWAHRVVVGVEPIVAFGVFAGIRSAGYAGHSPLWIIGCLLLFAAVFRQPEGQAWIATCGDRQRLICMGVHSATVIGIVYLSGWGPVVMPVGVAASLAMWLGAVGSKSWRPFALWSLAWSVLGQVAIAAGWIQSYISAPEVHGLAGLSVLGMLALASLLGKTTAQREEREVERDRAEDQVRASEQRFKALVHNASEIVQTINAEGVLTYVSPAIEAIMGYAPEDMVGRDGLLYVHPDDLGASIAILGSVVQDPSLIATHELRLRHADGSWHWHEAQCRNLLADPFVGALVVNQRDITERKTLEEKLRYQASHDVLTGLPNRALFSDRLEHALGRRERTGETLVVMLLDLDDFKSVNDTLGHHAGDNLLVNVAESLRTATRPGDTVCRLGGDEFAVLLESLPDRAAGEIVAPRIIDCFSNALRSAQRNTSVGASIGIAFSMTGATDAAELLRNADIAMYAAKASGKGSHQIYESDMDLPAGTRAQVRGDRLHAVHQGGGLPE